MFLFAAIQMPEMLDEWSFLTQFQFAVSMQLVSGLRTMGEDSSMFFLETLEHGNSLHFIKYCFVLWRPSRPLEFNHHIPSIWELTFCLALEQRLVNLFCQGPDSKQFRLSGHTASARATQRCCCSTAAAIGSCANKRTWLCSNTISFTQTGHGARFSLHEAVCWLQL